MNDNKITRALFLRKMSVGSMWNAFNGDVTRARVRTVKRITTKCVIFHTPEHKESRLPLSGLSFFEDDKDLMVFEQEPYGDKLIHVITYRSEE